MPEHTDNMIYKTHKALHKVSRWVAHCGMAMSIAMMLLVVVDVVLRFTLHKSILGSVELSSYMLSIIAFTTIPLVESEEMHISIPLVFDHFPENVRLVVNTLVNLIGAGLLMLISLACFQMGIEYFHRGKITQILGVPLYPFVFTGAFCMLLYTLILIVNTIKYIDLNR